ncbi:MAG: nucleotidyltransferase domain-containing protein [Chloroflexi bacterium]|nr:nucleotidyltransferase domain-containing protein [Chloroflexota bacterium]
MIPEIERYGKEIKALCERYHVRALYLFGSAATGRFNATTSDLDFLVDLADRQPTGEYANRYLDLADALERLFLRPVDLVTVQSIRNPYFKTEVEKTRQLIYEEPVAESVRGRSWEFSPRKLKS